jgi:phosphonate metabolism-associated iron-containing alcohol dehydrogenase
MGGLSKLNSLIPPGENFLLISSKGFAQRGTLEKISSILEGKTLTIYDSVTANPELDSLDELASSYSFKKFDGIIAIGGGSVIDTAKILSLIGLADIKNPLQNILKNNIQINWKRNLPLIAIPTTSGTGAEVTPFATVWDSPTHKKYSIANEFIFPKIALLDPELTVSLPEEVTLYTALDTISHALESLWNINRTPITTLYAKESLRLSIESLPILLKEPMNLHMRSQMQRASLLAGLAISITRTAIAHSISYPLTSHFNVPHGLACSFTLYSILSKHFNQLANGNEDLKLFEGTLNLLAELKLGNHIRQYASRSQILNLKDQMINKDRAGNFCFDLKGIEEYLE